MVTMTLALVLSICKVKLWQSDLNVLSGFLYTCSYDITYFMLFILLYFVVFTMYKQKTVVVTSVQLQVRLVLTETMLSYMWKVSNSWLMNVFGCGICLSAHPSNFSPHFACPNYFSITIGQISMKFCRIDKYFA